METLSSEAFQTVINEIMNNPNGVHAFQAQELIRKWLFEYEHGLLNISQEHLKALNKIM